MHSQKLMYLQQRNMSNKPCICESEICEGKCEYSTLAKITKKEEKKPKRENKHETNEKTTITTTAIKAQKQK